MPHRCINSNRFGDEGYKHYQVVEAGFKYNMMDLQAALGIHQLRRIGDSWLRREAIWKRYQQAFGALSVATPADPEPDTRHGYHLYTLMIEKAETGIDRDSFVAGMGSAGIGGLSSGEASVSTLHLTIGFVGNDDAREYD